MLAEDGYADKPRRDRTTGWAGAWPHIRLAAAVDEESGLSEEEGGLQQQRHPGLPEEGVSKPLVPEQTICSASRGRQRYRRDKRVMDQLTVVARAYGSMTAPAP